VIAGGLEPAYYHNVANRRAGAITISASGANAGHVSRWNTPIFASDCTTIVSDELVVGQDFVFYCLKSQQPYIQRELRRGAAQPHVYAKDIAHLEIPVPPLAEQQRIVAKLDVVSEQTSQLDRVAEVTALRWQDFYASVCRDAFEPRLGWTAVALPEISENLDGIRRPVTRSDRKPGPYPYYGASGIVDNVASYLFDEKLLLVSEDGANLLARSTPIAFTATGKCWVNNHAHVLRFKSPTLHAYVEAYLNSIPIDEWVTGAAQPKLTQGALNRIPIPIPGSESETEAVLNRIKDAQSISNAGLASSERRRRLSKDLKQSVLDAAFRSDL